MERARRPAWIGRGKAPRVAGPPAARFCGLE